jgi:hypothetical protein
MQARLEAQKVSPAAYQAMLGLEMCLFANNPSWRARTTSTGKDARVTDQRMRLLHRHALEGCACGG